MIDIQVAVDKLNGMDCEEIRHFFRLEGIKGRGSSRRCPIAVWLQKVTGNADILVGSSQAHVPSFDCRGIRQVRGTTYPLGAGPQAFIHRFDREQFPELMESIYRLT